MAITTRDELRFAMVNWFLQRRGAMDLLDNMEKARLVVLPVEPTEEMKLSWARSMRNSVHLDNYIQRAQMAYQDVIISSPFASQHYLFE